MRPERAAAVDYLRKKGTDAPRSRLLAGLRTTFSRFEKTIDGVPESMRGRRPTTSSWSLHEIVDHLVETHRPAIAELRDLLGGVTPNGGPIPARLTSLNPLHRPWAELTRELKAIHADLLHLVDGAPEEATLDVRAPFVMVIKVTGEHGSEILEWVEALDWKAYAQAIRVHTHEHQAQVERTISQISSVGT